MALRLTEALLTREPMGERLPSAAGEAPEADQQPPDQQPAEQQLAEEPDNITDAPIHGITPPTAPSTANPKSHTASKRGSSMTVSWL